MPGNVGNTSTCSVGSQPDKHEKICDEIFERWDKDQRSGKLLSALSGRITHYRADVDAVRVALSTPRSIDFEPTPRWRPIETAPKDGTKILLIGGTVESRHADRANKNVNGAIAFWFEYGEGSVDEGLPGWWCVAHTDVSEVEVCNPTHWMPLPSAPDEAVENASAEALLTEAVKALEEIAQAKMPGQARSIAHATLSKIKAEEARQ